MTQASAALNEVRQVADEELVARLRRLVRVDQALSARLLVHLGEVDARGLYRECACASMFVYCVEELHMSESQAYLRIHAARLGRQYPLVLQLLAQGELHLTAIKLLGPQLTADNHERLLQRASGKSKREIELLLAEIAPKPDVPCRMRKLPAPLDAGQATPGLITPPEASEPRRPSEPAQPVQSRDGDAARAEPSGTQPFTLEAPQPRASSKPLSPGRYKLELTAGQALHDKLQQLQDLLRHQVPDGDLAVLVERAVDLLLDKTLQQCCAQTRAPKKKASVGKPRRLSRYVPRAVVRAVHQRDAGRCTFISADGKRCSEHGFLELHHHDVPYARGGEASLENLRLLCRSHNALLAERDFGPDFMRLKRLRAREPVGPEREEQR